MGDQPIPIPNPTPPPAPPTPPADPPSPPPTPGDNTGVSIPKARFDEVNERMKAAEAALATANAAQAKVDEDRLAAEKKFEDLATKRAGERDEWKGKAEAAEKRATEMETRLHAIADARVKTLPEKLQAKVPAADAADALTRLLKVEDQEDSLEAARAEIPTKPITPGVGGGPPPVGSPGGKEEEAAARAGQARLYGQF